ncbi:hypothetical protein RHGRI_037330 [Rhododendron griersonianum]|uniref:Uncharacterized protein n=1 Tax=Rhododendron griersonianum TaxID=479676 RepID=A0AAV6HVL5_9ERIC|nr:hypothetical protein RHGRI_037330 [Rhododendron griersonianum]
MPGILSRPCQIGLQVTTARLESLCGEIIWLHDSARSTQSRFAPRAVAVEVDVSDDGPVVEAVVQRAWDAFGTIDVLISNAGVSDRGQLRPGAPLDHISGSVFDAVSTRGGSNVAAAEEEAVGNVGRAAASGEVVKAVGCAVRVGGENGEESVEVCLVGAVWGVENSIADLPSSVCNLIPLKSLCLDNNNVKQVST